MTPEQAQDALSAYRHSTSIGGPRVLETFKEAVATVAGQVWQYGVEQDNPLCNHIEHGADPTRCRFIVWSPSENTARIAAEMPFRADRHPRLVRRLVGPVQEVEG
ncbi:hypothetical protein AALF15_01240 [Corynebacteriaceae bacterium 7-707]